jgi:hypothetical protein
MPCVELPAKYFLCIFPAFTLIPKFHIVIAKDALVKIFILKSIHAGVRYRSAKNEYEAYHSPLFSPLPSHRMPQTITHIPTKIHESTLPAVSTAVIPTIRAVINAAHDLGYF